MMKKIIIRVTTTSHGYIPTASAFAFGKFTLKTFFSDDEALYWARGFEEAADEAGKYPVVYVNGNAGWVK